MNDKKSTNIKDQQSILPRTLVSVNNIAKELSIHRSSASRLLNKLGVRKVIISSRCVRYVKQDVVSALTKFLELPSELS